MKEQPNYYAILTADVRYDERLKANEKLLYAEITALATKDGYCWASNTYFANLYKVTNRSVSGWISNLENAGLIKVEQIRNEEGLVTKRKIFINDTYGKNFLGYGKNFPGGIEKNFQGVWKKTSSSNNTSINNTSINKDIVLQDKTKYPYKEIINYLNEVTGSNYSHTTDKTKRLIKARINEGHDINDFKKVIDNKYNSWNGTEWQKYLRPSTLFGTKFEGYLNEKVNSGTIQAKSKKPQIKDSDISYEERQAFLHKKLAQKIPINLKGE